MRSFRQSVIARGATATWVVLVVPVVLLVGAGLLVEGLRDFWPWLVVVTLCALVAAALSRAARGIGVALSVFGAVMLGFSGFGEFGFLTGIWAGLFVVAAISGPAIAAGGSPAIGSVVAAQTWWAAPFFVAGCQHAVDGADGGGILAVVVGLLGAVVMVRLAAALDQGVSRASRSRAGLGDMS